MYKLKEKTYQIITKKLLPESPMRFVEEVVGETTDWTEATGLLDKCRVAHGNVHIKII